VTAAEKTQESEYENDAPWKPIRKSVQDYTFVDLFAPVPEELGMFVPPTQFPKPTHLIPKYTSNSTSTTTVVVDVVPIVRPILGRHRTNVDAVFAYAEGYKLPYYMMFVETLKETGFTGDVVLAIAEDRILQPNVKDYLATYALPVRDDEDHENEEEKEEDGELHVVIYQMNLDCEPGKNAKSTERVRAMERNGDLDVFQFCAMDSVYGWKDIQSGKILQVVPDPRSPRVVATLRYEWYWIWSLQYQPQSWILLLDARDSYFQSNPFANVPRDTDENNNNKKDGWLYLFGENPEATRLGRSRKNMMWLRNGYGEHVLNVLAEKPTICSGSTMGEQIAIETYLRAMVNEHDECDIKMTGSDQGFHNYLYYSNKLSGASTIREIVVWEQGRGIVNNLGALRTKPFVEWGFYDETNHIVYQWDGETPSPVVHQFDRDGSLHKYMTGQRHREWQTQWNNQNNNNNNSDNRKKIEQPLQQRRKQQERQKRKGKR
jgi:hypothetical protein